MGRLNLQIELLDELIFSQRSASLGGHGSLDHIPGAALLGAAAARLYKSLGREQAWLAFHSGKLRFGNGLPVSADGAQGWPLPLCWHQVKGEEVLAQDRLTAGRVFNLMHCEGGKLPGEDSDRQPKQLREGYVTADGQLIKPETAFRMRTAISPDTGRAADAQLFGFQSLAAGQRFRASIDWNGDVPVELIDQIKAVFGGELLLGRSRSAQFGRARCCVLNDDPAGPRGHETAEGFISLWLLSDLAAVDGNGMPTLTPTAEDLGLPWGKPLPDKTFTRFRSYAPYNTHHHLYGRERQVISAGSVLSFHLEAKPSAEQLEAWRQLIASGLGLYRESGLGRAVLEPELLRDIKPKFPAPLPSGEKGRKAPPPVMPAHAFAQWLVKTTENQEADTKRKQWAEEKAKQLEYLEKSARLLAGLADKEPAGPGKSQWGRVSEAAKTAAQGNDGQATLHASLFDPDSGVCKPGDPDWGRATQLGSRSTTFADWLRGCLEERPADGALCLGLLANLAQKRLNH